MAFDGTLRPCTDADTDGIVALYGRVHDDDPTFDAIDAGRWRASLSINANSPRVIADGARIAAVAAAMRLEDPRVPGGIRHLRIIVDPAHRRRGLGDRLLDDVAQRARAEGVTTLQGVVDGAWASGLAFARARGFAVHVRNLMMTRDVSAVVEPALVEGVALRPFDGQMQDAAAWAAMHNEALMRDREFTLETPDSIATHANAPNTDVWFAVADRPVGFVHAQVRGTKGFVHEVGVVGAWEGRGIGAALVARAIARLTAMGAADIVLCTEEDNARAIRLYQRHGFAVTSETFTLRR